MHYLAEQMAEKHRDLFSLVTEDEWNRTVSEIVERIPELSDPEIVMELFQLSATPNDNHSFPFIMVPSFDLYCFPFQIHGFHDGWFITDTGREYKQYIGARIVKIGSDRIEDIYEKYPLFLGAENEYSRKERFTYMTLISKWLAYHGIIDNIHEADFTLEIRSGDEVVITSKSIKFFPHFLWSGMFTVSNDKPSVVKNPREDSYRFGHYEDSNTLFIEFNQCENQSDRETVSEFAERLEEFLKTHDIERCVVDVRKNDGGSRVYGDLIRVLRDNEKINRHGSLFLLIGRRTFSAAVMFATELQLQTKAILVGEPTGQGPIFFGGPLLVELPNSRLQFSASTHLTVAGLPFDGRSAIFPDVPVKYTSEDFIVGRDPVLETALAYQPPDKAYKFLPDNVLYEYAGRYLLNPVQVMDIENDGNLLRISLTDFIPGSGLRFQSDLYPTSRYTFETDLADVILRVPDFSEGEPDRVILDWMGVEKTLHRAPADYISAFETFSLGEIDLACEAVKKQREFYVNKYADLENRMNRLGYTYLHKDSVRAALKIFSLNVDLFPKASNVYDSYGEALLANGQTEMAIQNYQKSLELNPENKNAERVLKELGDK